MYFKNFIFMFHSRNRNFSHKLRYGGTNRPAEKNRTGANGRKARTTSMVQPVS